MDLGLVDVLVQDLVRRGDAVREDRLDVVAEAGLRTEPSTARISGLPAASGSGGVIRSQTLSSDSANVQVGWVVWTKLKTTLPDWYVESGVVPVIVPKNVFL